VLCGGKPSPCTGKGSASLTPESLVLEGPVGKFTVTLVDESGGPNLTIEDNEGYSTVIGRSDLVLTKTGKKEETPAASLVLLDKGGKVLWSAP